MVRNKNRLYVALYPTGGGNNEAPRYHWGLLVGPKVEGTSEVPGTRYHVKNNPIDGWVYEELPVRDVRTTNSLLARVLIGKVENDARLKNTFRGVPVIQNDPNWRCRTWVTNAVAAIARDGKSVGTAELDWDKIEATARQYVSSKSAAGRYQNAVDFLGPKPTWDMLENREIVS
ncbi:hypothetical protein AJ78_06745 [Emergomyces pasteurianus Ep9510]|uniref:Uncharacterized protein n=1 Tax=Emergomyces pasteurianus Ep9510 TaxID=1447872 RepID=A0A1J9P9E4_9EURO|nr:hypothetical protein AJ78_06745 [Emergomyces pasteurianus Ep9510]